MGVQLSGLTDSSGVQSSSEIHSGDALLGSLILHMDPDESEKELSDTHLLLQGDAAKQIAAGYALGLSILSNQLVKCLYKRKGRSECILRYSRGCAVWWHCC